ncbi:MAG: DUF1382 family protein [Pseudomonadota bacterium]|nr:DUF1382 family protein [Pseudomonadota bacterium]
MNKASPAEARRSLEAANAYVKAGIPFVPMPVLDDTQHKQAVVESVRRLEQLESES